MSKGASLNVGVKWKCVASLAIESVQWYELRPCDVKESECECWGEVEVCCLVGHCVCPVV